MTNSIKAKIYWLKPKEGGKEKIQHGSKYSTVAKFKDIEEKWPNEAWSIVAEINEPPTDYVSICNFSFLVEWAPSELLYSGSKFELYEGNRLVAKGEIL